jgi:ABC-type dipeptide/oligopeptide/nickel transport system permease component
MRKWFTAILITIGLTLLILRFSSGVRFAKDVSYWNWIKQFLTDWENWSEIISCGKRTAVLVCLTPVWIGMWLLLRFFLSEWLKLRKMITLLLSAASFIPAVYIADFVSTRFSVLYLAPALILGLGDGFLSELMRQTEDAINQSKRERYLFMAKARGEKRWLLMRNEIFINLSQAFVPRLVALISSAVAVEWIFKLKGIGWLAVDAAVDRNTPMLLSIIVCLVSVVCFLNLLNRLIAAVLDPRIRQDYHRLGP